MASLTSDDFEDHLDNFIIRKQQDEAKTYIVPQKQTKTGQKIHEHIPLLVRDILQSTPDPDVKDVFKLFNPTELSYRSCLVYGFVAGLGAPNKAFSKYQIDDGTGTIEITIFAKPKGSEIIRCLHNEAKSLECSTGTRQHEKVLGSMIRLLDKSEEYIDGSKILPGSNVLLFGRPNQFREEIVMNVFSFSVDNARSRKLEIAFNDNLLDFYQSHRAT